MSLDRSKLLQLHRLKRRNRSHYYLVFLGIAAACFVGYTVFVVGKGAVIALGDLEARKISFLRDNAVPLEEDEVTRLLGGPDEGTVVLGRGDVLDKRDLSSMERSLTRLLRMRRLMGFEESGLGGQDYLDGYSGGGETELGDDIHVRLPRKATVVHTSRNQSKKGSCTAKNLNTSVDIGDESVFPTDLFSLDQRLHGAIILHFLGLAYMFIALAVVCDEFFVPSLGVITEVLNISEDVAGATFMAAGGSAPEFFTSVFGVFITQNNVGIGTIVGSATFNILCVLACCTLFSKTVLHLTWWPLFRDITFYVVALLFLVLFFMDELIDWHEAFVMLVIYVLYGCVMKYNSEIEFWVKSRIFKKRGTVALVNENELTETTQDGRRKSIGSVSVDEHGDHRKSIPVLHSGAMFRAGIAQMVLEEDEAPVHDTPSSLPVTSRHEQQHALPAAKPAAANNGRTVIIGPGIEKKLSKATSFPAYHGTVGAINGTRPSTRDHQNGGSKPRVNGVPPIELHRSITRILEDDKDVESPTKKTKVSISAMSPVVEISEVASFASPLDTPIGPRTNGNGLKMYPDSPVDQMPQILEMEHEAEQPIDMSWPQTFKKRCIYVFLTPIMWPLYITLPDVRKDNRKNFVIVTFVGSVLWIAFYSYLMVWWANTIGVTLGIPTEVMGLTVLAAGTSIPDLITSVIVARKGLGDMAVSSSIGSNLFDICVGLPIPWLLFFAIQKSSGTGYKAVAVISNGLICSVGMLFAMMIVLVVATGVSGWKMNKAYGVTMIIAYVVFCLFSVFLELGKFTCPLRITGYESC